MAVANVVTPNGFDLQNLWVNNLRGAENLKLGVELSRSGSPGLGQTQTIVYRDLSFVKDGLTYVYSGEWEVRYDRGLLIGSVGVSGHYDSIKVSSGSTQLANYRGEEFEVDFGTRGNIPLVDLLLNVLSLLINPQGPTGGSYANLNTDRTPNLSELAFAKADVIRGSVNADTLRGGNGDDRIFGGDGDDTLYGGGGNDRLDGGSGIDTMRGGAGNDIYIVDSASDIVIEAAGEGTDTVLSVGSYTLAAGQHIERLQALDARGTAELRLTGNEFANTLRGNDGANVLDGGGGADVMWGYGGDDGYRVDNVRDRVLESVGGGYDTVWTTVSYVLEARQEIEKVVISPSTGTQALNLRGNEFVNELVGNEGNNLLDGRGGKDILFGMGGDDRLVVHETGTKVDGGTGTDTVIVRGNSDIVFRTGDVINVERYLIEQNATVDFSLLAQTPGEISARSAPGQEVTIIGSRSADRIMMSDGDIDVTGGRGNDVYYASTGRTTLHFESAGFGRDTLHNGGRGELVLDFSGVADSMDDLTFTVSGRDVLITAAGGGSGDSLLVKGMTLAQLTAHAEFTFV
ncbi:calcium-binding protein [Enterovirga rhinocerotis]|uniref:Hemolysin type calcium-binding protein n=1 Tax=Enterovirga rhinocerotis TaxID=1339210 RepID=A0A4R7BJH1_9HYPH|nr:calcium-binding protein [Enterovirga rhinocerotis]TDR85530.1 hemolysin type calcium-binding protein [Enterovirga rhinocerotis]